MVTLHLTSMQADLLQDVLWIAATPRGGPPMESCFTAEGFEAIYKLAELVEQANRQRAIDVGLIADPYDDTPF